MIGNMSCWPNSADHNLPCTLKADLSGQNASRLLNKSFADRKARLGLPWPWPLAFKSTSHVLPLRRGSWQSCPPPQLCT